MYRSPFGSGSLADWNAVHDQLVTAEITPAECKTHHIHKVVKSPDGVVHPREESRKVCICISEYQPWVSSEVQSQFISPSPV